MDKKPLTLLGTSGFSDEALLTTRRYGYMNELRDIVLWEGELLQPMIHTRTSTRFMFTASWHLDHTACAPWEPQFCS
jgi:hypothetical protein